MAISLCETGLINEIYQAVPRTFRQFFPEENERVNNILRRLLVGAAIVTHSIAALGAMQYFCKPSDESAMQGATVILGIEIAQGSFYIVTAVADVLFRGLVRQVEQ